MSTKVTFGNKAVQLPGSYSRIVSAQTNPPRNLDYGRLLIIDNGNLTATFSANGILGGSGVNGTNYSGKDALYTFSTIEEFRDFSPYGWWWKAAEFLFNPDGNWNGVSTVTVVKPASTAPASLTFTATGGGSDGGTFKLTCLDEGLAANGVGTTALTSGYAFSVETGVLDTSKWIFKIYRGTYRGLAPDGVSYDEISTTDAKPILIAQSPEFDNIQNLIDWANTDPQLGKYFKLDPTSAVAGAGTVTATDVTGLTTYVLASGGTETYDSIDLALTAVTDQNYNYILTTSSTADPSADTNILKIQDFINNTSLYNPSLIVAGDDSTLATTVGYAQTFNDEKVDVVHGGIKKTSQSAASGFRIWNSFFHTAYYAGLILGKSPQTPVTFKSLNIEGIQDNLSENDKLLADSSGVLATYFDQDFGEFVCLHDVNTLQNNDYVLNNDGTSHVIQIVRIKAQLNNELKVNSKTDLLSSPVGNNQYTLSGEDAVEWTKSYLQRRIGTLITNYKNVNYTTSGDNLFVTYEASPNTEVKGLFFTGGLYL